MHNGLMPLFKVNCLNDDVYKNRNGMGWDGIYCGYGVATALKIVHWSTPFLTRL